MLTPVICRTAPGFGNGRTTRTLAVERRKGGDVSNRTVSSLCLLSSDGCGIVLLLSLPFQDLASCLFSRLSTHALRRHAGWESRKSTYRCGVSPSEDVDHVTEGGALAQVVYDVDL